MYQDFISDLENFLLRYNISYKHTSVFIDSLFTLAGITHLPKKSELAMVENDHGRITFKIKHISEMHARMFISYLVRKTDDTATCEVREDKKEPYYCFEASVKDVHNYLLPAFEIHVLKNLSTKQFDVYREQSNHCLTITEFKLKNEIQSLESQYNFISHSLHFLIQHIFPLQITQALKNTLALKTNQEKLQEIRHINRKLLTSTEAHLTPALSALKQYCELYEQNLIEQTSNHKNTYFLSDTQLAIYEKFSKDMPIKPKIQNTSSAIPKIAAPTYQHTQQTRDENPTPAEYTYFGV